MNDAVTPGLGLEQMDQLWAGCLSHAQGHNYTCFQEEKRRGLSLAGSVPHLLGKAAF